MKPFSVQNDKWTLQTSLQRYSSIPYDSESEMIEELLNKFRVNLSKLESLPYNEDKRIDWLEYAQHHGVPTPFLDFSYSPYGALFFAFNELDYDIFSKKNEYVVIYILKIRGLANIWARYMARDFKSEHMRFYDEFIYFKEDCFKECFPGHCLKFVPFPGKGNSRMQRQQGVFIYDTLNYKAMKFKGLEDFIASYDEDDATLTKVYINKKCAQEVFQKIELMGITGTMMYLDSKGAAMDVKNSYYYNAKTMYARDLRFPEPKI